MLYLGADHRGFKLKESLKKFFESKKISYQDLGNEILDPEDDFVDYAKKVAKEVARDKNSLGIVICGSGIGVNIAANKIKGIRSGLAITPEMARQGREHDDINVLVLAADYTDFPKAQKIIEEFLSTSFSSQEKYRRRLNKIKTLEDRKTL